MFETIVDKNIGRNTSIENVYTKVVIGEQLQQFPVNVVLAERFCQR